MIVRFPLLFLVAWFVIVTGIVIGAGVGYDAADESEVVVEYDGEILTVGNETSEVWNENNEPADSDLPFNGVLDPLDGYEPAFFTELEEFTVADEDNEPDPRLEAGIQSVADRFLEMSVGIASWSAPFFYWLSGFVPANVTGIGLAAFASSPFVWYLRELWRECKREIQR